MKAVSPLGGGQRGKLKVTVAGVMAVVALMLMVALVVVGCGGNAGNGNSASQLDDEAAGASGASNDSGVSPEVADVGSSGEGNVMTGYAWDQCVSEMTVRYGSEEVARQVCDSVQNEYSASPRSELPSALQVVESSLGVTPVNPSVPGGTAGGTTTTGGTSGGTSGSGNGRTGGNGWSGIEIVVPPSP